MAKAFYLTAIVIVKVKAIIDRSRASGPAEVSTKKQHRPRNNKIMTGVERITLNRESLSLRNFRISADCQNRDYS